MKEPFWIRFDFGHGLFIESEFLNEEDFYDYLDKHKEVVDWKRVDKGGT